MMSPKISLQSRGGQVPSLSSSSACILAISPAQDAATQAAWQQAGQNNILWVRKWEGKGFMVKLSRALADTFTWHTLAICTSWQFDPLLFLLFQCIQTLNNIFDMVHYCPIYEFPTHCWNHNAHNKHTQPPQAPAAQPARWYMNTLRPSLKKPSAWSQLGERVFEKDNKDL